MDQSLPADDNKMPEAQFITNLLQLNEYCLIAILEILPVDDLSSVASTCMQLNAIACTVFKLKPAAKKIFVLSQMHHNDHGAVITVKRRLQNFGHLLNEIKLHDHHFDELIFEEIVKYCSGGELQKLHINRFQLISKLVLRGANLFEHLKSLTALYLDGENANNFYVQFLPMCAKLEVLNLRLCWPNEQHLDELNFPNLTEFVLMGRGRGAVSRRSSTPSIEQFLLRHKLTIKKLDVRTAVNLNLAIFEEMPALEELEFHCLHSKYVQTNNLDKEPSKLKIIKFDYIDKTVSSFLNSLAPKVASSLEQLNFFRETNILFVKSLNNFHSLLSLNISGCVDSLTSVLKNVPFDTLTHLDIMLHALSMDSAFMLTLSQFRNLRSLKVNSHHTVADWDGSSLKNLEKITNFSYTGEANAVSWLTNFGSPQTMQNISLNVRNFEELNNWENFQALNRFSNLQVLAIDSSKYYAPALNKIDGLYELIELRLDLFSDCECGCRGDCKWSRILDLVKRLPKLHKLRLQCYRKYLQFKSNIFSEFVDIYRSRGAKLIIEFIDHNCLFHITADILEVYNDFCRFVEIQHTRKG